MATIAIAGPLATTRSVGSLSAGTSSDVIVVRHGANRVRVRAASAALRVGFTAPAVPSGPLTLGSYIEVAAGEWFDVAFHAGDVGSYAPLPGAPSFRLFVETLGSSFVHVAVMKTEASQLGTAGAAAAAAPSTPAFVALDIAASTGTLDPLSVGNGAASMLGESIIIPVSTSANAQGMNNALLFQWALPAGICDGSDGMLLTRITFGARPAGGAFGVSMGVYDAVTQYGLGAGARNATATAKMRPVAIRATAQTDGADLSATSLVALGYAPLVGSWNGSDLQAGAVMALMEESGASRQSCTINLTAVGLATADQRLVVAVTHSSGVPESESISVKCEYAVLSDPFA